MTDNEPGRPNGFRLQTAAERRAYRRWDKELYAWWMPQAPRRVRWAGWAKTYLIVKPLHKLIEWADLHDGERPR